VAALGAIARALRPGGVAMVLVQAHPRLYGSLDRAYGHERRYTPARLRSLARDAGLSVERLSFFNALGIPGWWARNLVGAGSLGTASRRAYEALLATWRPIERRIELPVGLSVVMHARRPA
jgi:hypothetical protein